jgi:hypothetical protein
VLAADAPNYTDIMQGWGSVLGVLVSGLAVLITGMLLRHEMKARREEKAEQEAAQARLIVVALESAEGDEETISAHWTVVNHSQAPIYDLTTNLRYRGATARGAKPRHLPYLPPEKTVTIDLPPSDPPVHKDMLGLFELTAGYTDAAGVRWRRVDTRQPEKHNGFLDAIASTGPRDPSLRLVWLYVWPISDPARWLRSKFRRAVAALYNHMSWRVRWRNNRRSIAGLKHREALRGRGQPRER